MSRVPSASREPFMLPRKLPRICHLNKVPNISNRQNYLIFLTSKYCGIRRDGKWGK